MMHLAKFIAALAACQGLNIRDLCLASGQEQESAQRELWQLCKRKKLFKLKSTPYVRYFTTAAIRDAMAETVKAEALAHIRDVSERKRARDNISRRVKYHAERALLAKLPKPPRKKRKDAGTSSKPPRPLAKAKPAKQIDTRPIDDSKAIRTVWPTPPGRYEVSKDFKGPFSLVGVGRDATTGQAWRD